QGDLTHLLCDVAGETVRMVLTHVNPLPRVGDKLALWFEPDDADNGRRNHSCQPFSAPALHAH
ncbi:TOBE domain-containing protein, partial [Salmonella enterica]|uniref:TOBE domain-containing protein n=1 Tax=Salmonella enterica TaxID=28901 RepID=UPI001D0C573A